jgi:hypothetical protein
MKYEMTIMTMGPDGVPCAQHRSIEATSPDEARRIVTKEFTENHLPVYWIKFN